jgi:hypothetical protein
MLTPETAVAVFAGITILVYVVLAVIQLRETRRLAKRQANSNRMFNSYPATLIKLSLAYTVREI